MSGDPSKRTLMRAGGPGAKLPLHERVAQALREHIRAHLQPGQKLPAIRELVTSLGVSMLSVRAAQALLVSEGLLEVRHGSGVYVAAGAVAWRVGVISPVDLFHWRTGHFFRGLAGAAMSGLRSRGMEPHLYSGTWISGDLSAPEPDSLLIRIKSDLAARRIDGAVLLNYQWNDSWYQFARSSPWPLVGPETGFNFEIDARALLESSVRILHDQGCTRIGLIAAGKPPMKQMFVEVLEELGLQAEQNSILVGLGPQIPGSGGRALQQLWSSEHSRPDGLVILDDVLFADIQLVLLQMGIRVPDDLKLVVQTNRGSAMPMRVPGTAMEVDPAEAARLLIDLLEMRLRNTQAPKNPPVLSYRKVPFGVQSASHMESMIQA